MSKAIQDARRLQRYSKTPATYRRARMYALAKPLAVVPIVGGCLPGNLGHGCRFLLSPCAKGFIEAIGNDDYKHTTSKLLSVVPVVGGCLPGYLGHGRHFLLYQSSLIRTPVENH
jgi:hypothetical protein